MIRQGLSIVPTAQISELLNIRKIQFESQYFTCAERDLAGRHADRVQYFASRLAAKRAVLKALDRGESKRFLWLEIEIQRLPTGQPYVVLSNRCQDIAAMLGVTQWLLSLSHTRSYAAASAIALHQVPS